LFRDLGVALPKGGTPGDNLTEVLVIGAAQGEGIPVAEGGRMNDGFQGLLAGVAVHGHPAQFQSQFPDFGDRFGLPEDIESDGGNLVGVFPEIGLIGVAIEEAGRYGHLPLGIEQEGEGLDDPAGTDGLARDKRKGNGQDQHEQKPAHAGTIKVPAGKFNLHLKNKEFIRRRNGIFSRKRTQRTQKMSSRGDAEVRREKKALFKRRERKDHKNRF